MAGNRIKVVLDTNILVSTLIFGGKPQQILRLCLEKEINAVTSNFLLAELVETLVKKFKFISPKALFIERKVKKSFELVYPKTTINLLKDKPDNRVLEAAVEGDCNYIITGDKELLELTSYKNVKIVNADNFLTNFTF